MGGRPRINALSRVIRRSRARPRPNPASRKRAGQPACDIKHALLKNVTPASADEKPRSTNTLPLPAIRRVSFQRGSFLFMRSRVATRGFECLNQAVAVPRQLERRWELMADMPCGLTPESSGASRSRAAARSSQLPSS